MHVAAATSPLVPSIIAAAAALIAAGIGAWAVFRTHTYEQLLKDIYAAVQEALDDPQRALAVAQRLEHVMRRVLEEILGTHPDRRRWYDR